jgi:hypothetical protein
MWVWNLVFHNGGVGGGDMLRVLEHSVLRKIFGSRRDEITRYCRKLHKDEVHDS